tara:strand:- start:3018 stop:4340 length:1323 start_codon:yes stop_codon:yes gene_type:complete
MNLKKIIKEELALCYTEGSDGHWKRCLCGSNTEKCKKEGPDWGPGSTQVYSNEIAKDTTHYNQNGNIKRHGSIEGKVETQQGLEDVVQDGGVGCMNTWDCEEWETCYDNECVADVQNAQQRTRMNERIKEELNRLEDMDYHNTPDMEKDISRDEIENFDDTIGQVEFQDELVTLSSTERSQLRDMLEDAMDDKRKLEEVFDYKGIPELKAQGVFGKMFKWLKRYLTDKATTYLINASAEETKDTIELIKVMDPNDMTGVFEPKAIYLGGAIDFATDALAWRTQMEEYFGENHVVKDERMAKLVLTGEWDTKGISAPAILNPLRAETVREEDSEFTDLFGKWKKDSLTDDEMQTFREKIRQNIILQDLRMLDICDTNLLRYDGKAGAGTLGEAQISALKNQQIFLWVTDGMKISNVSPWLLPAVTKICIDDEIWELIKHFR